MSSRGGGAGTMSSKSYQQAVAVVTGHEGGEMSKVLWCTEHANWRRLCPHCYDALEQQRDDLLALVEKVEWVVAGSTYVFGEGRRNYYRCPWCGRRKRIDDTFDSHDPDCNRQTTIARVRGAQ